MLKKCSGRSRYGAERENGADRVSANLGNVQQEEKHLLTLKQIVMKRKEAARELMGVWNNYEVRPIKFSTAYRWVFRNKCGFWQLNGHAHNYIV